VVFVVPAASGIAALRAAITTSRHKIAADNAVTLAAT
jgi:hypothetical protein